MKFSRKAYEYLLEWKDSPVRKPLIIRGARQVGKSTLVRRFSKEFSNYIEVNLEREENKNLFENSRNVKEVLEALYLTTATPKDDKDILIFLDEIQESPKAIQQLRYFYEDFPGIHVIAAGSLLEFALRKVRSFPVGRVNQYVLHPFDFEEFLLAVGRMNVLKELEVIPAKNYAHDILLDLFHQYAIIGGMPEVIKKYVTDNSMANLGMVYSDLWQSYRDDVEKYSRNHTEAKIIRHIMDTAPAEKDRISFAGFGNSAYRSREVGEAFRALDRARLIQLLYPSFNLKPPLSPAINRKPRLQFLDTGLLNYSLGIQAGMISIKDLNDFHQGRIIQHLVTQQVLAQYSSPLFRPVFWTREKPTSSAEVDLVIQYKQYVIPVEIKSGKQGKLRSLHQFVENAEHAFALRLLANKLSVEEVKTPGGKKFHLLNLPYYLSTKITLYMDWFIKTYQSTF